jgi:hypothetical protein
MFTTGSGRTTMQDDSIISLLKKIKALADRGVNGEREAAKAKLAALLKRYNIKPEDLLTETDRQEWPFKFANEDELDVLCHCYNTIRPSEDDQIHFKRTRRTRLAWFDLNKLELADLMAMWAHHRRHFRSERKKLTANLKRAYIQRQDLARVGGEERELTPEETQELMSVLALANGITRKPWLKTRALIGGAK